MVTNAVIIILQIQTRYSVGRKITNKFGGNNRRTFQRDQINSIVLGLIFSYNIIHAAASVTAEITI